MCSIVSCSPLIGMEKDKTKEDSSDTKDTAQPKARKSSFIEKAALKASLIAANSGHKKTARAAAKLGDPSSPTLAVHQATLTKDPEKKAEFIKKAAMLNPGRASAAKEEAAQKSYETSRKEAYSHLKNAVNLFRHCNESEAEVTYKLFEEECKNMEQFYKELLRAQLLSEETPIDEADLSKEAQINTYELRYIWELEFYAECARHSSHSPSEQMIMDSTLSAAETYFAKYYVLKHTGEDHKELMAQMKTAFSALTKEAIGEEDASEKSDEKSTAAQKGSSDHSDSEEQKEIDPKAPVVLAASF